MAGEWRYYKIGELGKVVTGKTPSTKEPDNFGGPYPFITIPDLGQRVYIDISERTLSEIGAGKMKTLLLPPNSVMMSCIATIGKCGITTKPSFTNQQINSVICDPIIVDPLFLYYVFTQIGHELESAGGGGSVYTNVSKSRFSEISVLLPPLPEQRAIAAVLGALDDKIELNRRMNRTLESIAQAVFREMMKDEGGRMNGRETTIGEVVTVVGGTTPSTTNSAFWGGDICWATPKDLASLQSPILLDTNSRITELGLQEISSGILPAGTVLLSSRAPIGYVAITHIPVAINQGFIAIKCTDEVPNYFILNWLKDNMEEIIGRANGTTFLEISKSNFRTIPIFIPPVEKMKNFVEIVEPIYQKIVANLKQSRKLAALRDALLPKLMRGEVRVTVHE